MIHLCFIYFLNIFVVINQQILKLKKKPQKIIGHSSYEMRQSFKETLNKLEEKFHCIW